MTDANAPRAPSDTPIGATESTKLSSASSTAPSTASTAASAATGTYGASAASSTPSAAASSTPSTKPANGAGGGSSYIPPASSFTPPPGGRGTTALWIVLLLVIVATAGGGYWLYMRVEHGVNAITDRQAHDNDVLAQTQLKSDQSLAASHQLDNQVATLTSKLGETQNQQQALQQLYQDLARNRDDWVMTDAEQTLSTANQQLQLTGNVQLALYALQNADAQLATTDAPQVLEVRRAVAADIDKLKASPQVDLPGLALRLDQAIAQVDALPLAGDVPADGKPSSTANAAGATDATPPAVKLSPMTAAYWRQLWARITHGLGDSATHLVQVRRIDHSSADAMLVAPEQAEYLRENVKLRLLSARLSLLSRNEATLQSDLSAADDTLARYFDPSSAALGVVRTTIANVRQAAQQVTVPTLDGSLQALRQYKSRG